MWIVKWRSEGRQKHEEEFDSEGAARWFYGRLWKKGLAVATSIEERKVFEVWIPARGRSWKPLRRYQTREKMLKEYERRAAQGQMVRAFCL